MNQPERFVRHKRGELPEGRTDWARVRSMTDEEIGIDPENPPWTAEDFAKATLVYPRCDVCHGESGGAYAGVACSSLGAVSFAYCDRCLANHAEPAGMLQAIITEAGGIGHCADWVRDLTGWRGGAYVSAADLPPLDLTETADEPT